MGNWITDLWYNLSGLKEEDIKRSLINLARDFVFSYIGSPGFNERLPKALEYLKQYEQNTEYNKFPKYLSNNMYDYTYGIRVNPSIIYTKYESPDGGAYFDPKKNTVYIPNKNYNNSRVLEDYGNTAAHEYGHALINSIDAYLQESSNFYKKHPEYNGKDTTHEIKFKYPNIFPHFRNSKSYQLLLLLLPDGEARANYERYPDMLYDETSVTHDANPSESYSDLMALRYDLMMTNIYDSRKANNPFTKKHLYKYKKLKRRNRIFDNFTDELIILMMNDIAQNNTPKANQLLYAKRGTKLISKKFK